MHGSAPRRIATRARALQGRLQGALPVVADAPRAETRGMLIKTSHLLLGYAVLAGAAAIVVPAMPQDQPPVTIESNATASPNRAGTAEHPRGVALRAAARLVFPPDVEAPI